MSAATPVARIIDEGESGWFVVQVDQQDGHPVSFHLSEESWRVVYAALGERFTVAVEIPVPEDPKALWRVEDRTWQIPQPDVSVVPNEIRQLTEERDGAQFALAIAQEKIHGLEWARDHARELATILRGHLDDARATVDMERGREAQTRVQLQSLATAYQNLQAQAERMGLMGDGEG